MKLGTCKMCLLEKDLVSSHLMPRALYAYVYEGDLRPIKYGDGVLIPTDRQTQDYLLCEDCEDILNQGGESWITDKLATWERTFPLYETLTKLPADFDEDGMVVYFAAKNPDIKIDKLTHFALGLFWKASVHSWKGDSTEPRIELGPYSEDIRKWLRGGGSFPKNVYLLVLVERPARAQITMSDPYEGERNGGRAFFVHVPGVLFMLAVGKTVDEWMRALCVQNSPGNPINISESLTTKFTQYLAETFRNARKTNAFLKAKEKGDEARKMKPT
jgi:hypothetical protein